jgi:CRP-like cAMP-binding protein
MPRLVIDKRSLVTSIPLFAQLSADELDALLDIAVTRTLAPREVLFRKGDPGTELFGILEGSLRATTPSAHGKEVTFSVMGSGEIFGEIALLDGRPRSATIEAVEEARVIAVERAAFLEFMERHPGVAVRLMGVLAARVRRVSELIEDILFMNVPSRLSKRLLALARLFGRTVADGVRIDMKLSAADLGDLIGASGESVTRQLELWTSQQVVSVRGDEIVLLRPDLLESYAELTSL